MIIHISYKRMWQVAVVFLLLILAWFMIGHYARVTVDKNLPKDKVVFTVKFLVPMLKDKTVERLSIVSQIPGRKVTYNTEWTSLNTVKITIVEKQFPLGLEYQYKFNNAPALLPLFRVSVKGKVLHPVKPKLVSLCPKHNVPTGGPITLKFNTFVNPESFAASLEWEGGSKFKPVTQKGPKGDYIDYSEWRVVPRKKLQNNHEYKIIVKSGLTAQNGLKLGENEEVGFITAPAFTISAIYPEPESASVWLGRKIAIETNQKLKEAQITVQGVKGVTEVKENAVYFIPERVFRSDRRYQVKVELISIYGEKINRQYSFHTVNLGSQKWLEVKLGKSCFVLVLAGDKEVRKISACTERKPPMGTLYEDKRGTAYGSPEGYAPPWIRLNADVLLHALPRGNGGATQDNHQKLGLPDTHACLYMSESDINWLYEFLPRGFMVIVH